MTRRKLIALYQKCLDQRGTLGFRDFEALLSDLGFELVRQSGSHRTYIHPDIERPFPVQVDGKDAKRYQVRQLRDMILRYGLKLQADE